MSKSRRGSTSRERGAKGSADDWKRIVSTAALVLAVAGTLIAAALLRAGPDPVPDRTGSAPPERTARDSGVDAPSPVLPAPAPATETEPVERIRVPEPPGDPLALRAAGDRRRLASHADAWTLQFARLCESDHAADILAELAGREDLYLVERNGCYLVCWGLYGTADLARSAGEIPPTLSGLPDHPFPKRVEAALR
jgi:hypothetical protein